MDLWVEKYRPETLEELVANKTNLEKFRQYIEEKSIPHLQSDSATSSYTGWATLTSSVATTSSTPMPRLTTAPSILQTYRYRPIPK